MPPAVVVGFRVHWDVFTSCAKQKFVFSADQAAAAEASSYPSEHQADWDSGDVVVTLIIRNCFIQR